MKSYIVLFSTVYIVIFSSCMKKPIEGKKHAQFDVNGVQWTTLGHYILYSNRPSFSAYTQEERTGSTEYKLFFTELRKTMARQYFGNTQQTADTCVAYWTRSIGDQPVFSYKSIVGDTANNYIQILHQEGDYTQNLRAVFSLNVVGGFANADTIRIRNGVIDFAKEF